MQNVTQFAPEGVNPKTLRKVPDLGLPINTKGLGAADASTVLGINPWKSAYELYLEKVGEIEKEPFAESEAQQWGLKLEPVLRDHYKAITSRELIDRATVSRNNSRFDMRTHPARDYIVANLDYEVDKTGTKSLPSPRPGHGVLELKNVSGFKAEQWQEEPPQEVIVQLQHQLMTADFEWGSVAALVGGNAFVWRDYERDDEFCELLLKELDQFWERILDRNPPPTDASFSTKRALKKLFPKDDGSRVKLSPAATEAVYERNRIIREKIQLEEEIASRENFIKSEIGDATYGDLSDGGGCVSYKLIKRAPYAVNETEYRSLRFHKGKLG